MTGWIITGIIYALGFIVFLKMSRDNKWLRASLWPLFVVTSIMFS